MDDDDDDDDDEVVLQVVVSRQNHPRPRCFRLIPTTVRLGLNNQ